MHAIVPNLAPFGAIKHTRVYQIQQTIGISESGKKKILTSRFRNDKGKRSWLDRRGQRAWIIRKEIQKQVFESNLFFF